MKLVNILTDFQHEGTSYFKDEAVKVSPAEAEYFCRAGWARDPSGEFQTGKPGPNDVVLVVQNLTIGQKAAAL